MERPLLLFTTFNSVNNRQILHCRRWNRDVYTKAPEKSFIHRAEADINESIEELKYYKKCLFDPKTA